MPSRDSNKSLLVHRISARSGNNSSHNGATNVFRKKMKVSKENHSLLEESGHSLFPTPGAATQSKSKSSATLARAHVPPWLALFFCFSFISMEVGKQITSYGVQYYNKESYPVPQTGIVFATEVTKLLLMLVLLIKSGALTKVTMSFMFAVPSIVYATTNNLYFFALHYVTPPIWSVLIQSRVIITALVYRFWFKREVTKVQWVGLVLLVIAIAMTQLKGDTGEGLFSSLFLALLLSLLQAGLSVIASVFTEYLFKNDQRKFVEQQFQMYLFSSFISLGFYLAEAFMFETSPATFQSLRESTSAVHLLLIAAILFASLGGIAVASIVRKLDNIVKIYCAALANMFTAISCAFLFPNKFTLDLVFAVALIIMFVAIYLYEKKKLNGNFCSKKDAAVQEN